MLRNALVLLAASGCDYAVGLQHIVPERGACGPYASVTPVSIVGVEEARGFSVNADGTMALVTGKDSAGQTRPIVLHLNGSDWEPDPTPNIQTGLTAGMKGAKLAPPEPAPNGAKYPAGPLQPAMLLSTVPTGQNKLQVGRYYWTGTTWQQDTNQPAFSLAGYDVYPGNVWIRVGDANPDVDRVRHTVLWMVTQDPSEGPNKVAIMANTPNSFTLEDRARTVGFNSLGARVGQAVMTEDRAKLVYSALSGIRSDIFAVAQDTESRTFDDEGGGISTVNTNDDEVEPWINADCSQLYFRRIPAETPNEAGQIFVAQ
ncbi:MAG TPA: hypothetical protein VMZ53_24865 [Kofleriaceae bacterium]|nr:hypothetical protein [Kofleriaceae bacterium]